MKPGDLKIEFCRRYPGATYQCYTCVDRAGEVTSRTFVYSENKVISLGPIPDPFPKLSVLREMRRAIRPSKQENNDD